jgi:ABC-type glycerol-3-phosphate transport system permease component
MTPERAATRPPLPIVTCGARPTAPPSTAKSSSVTLPVLLLTVFAQRQIVAGLTAGAVKGG